MSYKLTILGCGGSTGVPRIGAMWGACDPGNPKNRRLRPSVLIDRLGRKGRTRVLVDTSPDLREQLIRLRADWLDGVIYTHDHADHTHGIDDLRLVSYCMKRRIESWADKATADSLQGRFGYCFKMQGTNGYPPIMAMNEIDHATPVVVNGAGGAIEAIPIVQEHGAIISLGFRVGGLAYSPDVSGIPEASVPLLENLDIWVVDALRYQPHPTHFHLKRTLEWIERVKPKRAVLTHMTVDLDYDTLRRELPAHIEPAYDGMEIEF